QSASAKSLFNEFSTEILEINGRNAIIKNSDDIVLGSSGIVTHTFENGISTIVARADVIKKDGDKATIKFGVYKLSTQAAFPKPGILPAVGDKLILNYLYDRALIVAPNYKVYKEVTTHFKEIDWVHPDIVGAYLAKIFRPNPDREIFQKTCEINSVGLIFFALNNKGYFVDCSNFKSVKEVKTSHIKKAQVPFYTRIKGIDTNWMKWSSSNITDYNEYYRSMIGK
ncbi:plasminogen-binding N-terminal domain-containing protein, partial [Sulfurospirillum sp.]|nr:plasminogen-binding N-terminal domain-containing protein [Sulfurospirillum sp.]